MTNSTEYKLSASASDKGTRLDKFIAQNIGDLSRSRIKNLIEEGHVLKLDKTITDCSYRVKPEDIFTIKIPEAVPTDMRAKEGIPLDIVYEDDQFLVINKQAGLTVHPGAGNYDDTMANALLAHCGDSLSGIGGVSRPGIVHRLDKDTSGLILAAKTDNAHNNLSKQIAERTMQRVYKAICWGVPKPHKATITNNIARSAKNRIKMAVVKSGGKQAITHYEVKEIYGNGAASLIECRLQTGRTHQIRVQMTEYGHPLIGDQLYGRRNNSIYKTLPPEIQEFIDNFKRQALHSFQIGVENPSTNAHMEFVRDVPEDMAELIRLLKDLKIKQ